MSKLYVDLVDSGGQRTEDEVFSNEEDTECFANYCRCCFVILIYKISIEKTCVLNGFVRTL